ncbi:SPASM domain-containing protein [bacterium]|nr:SPASM domain-containing protein [bacterium]
MQKQNYGDFFNIVNSAKEIGLDQISFLAADVSTNAFNRTGPWNQPKQSSIALNARDCEMLESILKDSFGALQKEYQLKFIAESPKKMMELLHYYQGLLGLRSFPLRRCNAPWVSAVIESDGEVRPCFFHKSYGNIYDVEFEEVINSQKAISFRKNLKVNKDVICERCVCSLYR